MMKRLWFVVSVVWSLIIFGTQAAAGHNPTPLEVAFGLLPWILWLLAATLGRWIVTGSWTRAE
jgi:hypothetical protein